MTAAVESMENLWYLCTVLINVYVAGPDPDPDPDPDPNPNSNPNPKPNPIPYLLGEGVNYLTLRVQFYANECKEGRDAKP